MPFARWFQSLLCVAVVSPMSAQLPQSGAIPLPGTRAAFRSPDLRVDVDLVLLPVTVTDRSGAAVDYLPETSFTVFEDNSPRSIVSFSHDDVPCSVGVVVDISGSMESKMGAAADAMGAFFGAANPEDEAFLLTVSTRPDVVSGFTSDFGNLQSQLRTSRAGGATALVDTIQLALGRLRYAHNARRALLIISDGIDNHSRYSEAELLRLAQEADVQIYTIGTASSEVSQKGIQLMEGSKGLVFLSHLAGRSGGLSFTLNSYENPALIASKIGRAIRDQYVIGYQPSPSQPGKWRAVRVKVSIPQVHVSSRNGYYAR